MNIYYEADSNAYLFGNRLKYLFLYNNYINYAAYFVYFGQ